MKNLIWLALSILPFFLIAQDTNVKFRFSKNKCGFAKILPNTFHTVLSSDSVNFKIKDDVSKLYYDSYMLRFFLKTDGKEGVGRDTTISTVNGKATIHFADIFPQCGCNKIDITFGILYHKKKDKKEAIALDPSKRTFIFGLQD